MHVAGRSDGEAKVIAADVAVTKKRKLWKIAIPFSVVLVALIARNFMAEQPPAEIDEVARFWSSFRNSRDLAEREMLG